MDILLLIFGFILILVGLIGSFLPILPGPLASWLGLASLYASDPVPSDSSFLWTTLAIVVVLTLADNFIPALGTKKFGGSKAGVRGSFVGGFIGLFFGPIGIILGPFLGALAGELLNNSKDLNVALKAAMGSFIGFILSTGIKLCFGFVMLYYFFDAFWPVKSDYF